MPGVDDAAKLSGAKMPPTMPTKCLASMMQSNCLAPKCRQNAADDAAKPPRAEMPPFTAASIFKLPPPRVSIPAAVVLVVFPSIRCEYFQEFPSPRRRKYFQVAACFYFSRRREYFKVVAASISNSLPPREYSQVASISI